MVDSISVYTCECEDLVLRWKKYGLNNMPLLLGGWWIGGVPNWSAMVVWCCFMSHGSIYGLKIEQSFRILHFWVYTNSVPPRYLNHLKYLLTKITSKFCALISVTRMIFLWKEIISNNYFVPPMYVTNNSNYIALHHMLFLVCPLITSGK